MNEWGNGEINIFYAQITSVLCTIIMLSNDYYDDDDQFVTMWIMINPFKTYDQKRKRKRRKKLSFN